MTLDQAASVMIPTIANESEQASPTGYCVLLKLKLGRHKHATKAEYITHILCYTLFFTVKQKAHQESQLTTPIVLSVFMSLVTFDLPSLREISFHCEIIPTVIKCVVSQSGQIIYCVCSEDYKLNIG